MNQCSATNAAGEPCRSPLVDESGFCQAHKLGGRERLRAQGAKGGEATQRVWHAPGFAPGELQPLVDVDDAQLRIDLVGRAASEGKITEKLCDSLTKNAAEWVKANTAGITSQLVKELRSELDAKAKEIETLRKQLGMQAGVRPKLVAR